MDTVEAHAVTVKGRFCGSPNTASGGYIAGLLGRLLDVVWPESLSNSAGRTSFSYKADGYRGCLEFARALGHEV